MRRFLLSAAALAMMAFPLAAAPTDALAQDDVLITEAERIIKALPRKGSILQVPEVEVYTSYGTGSVKTVKSDVVGGEARSFTINGKGANPWDAAIQAPNALNIAKGDVVHTAFWARAAELPKGQSSTRIPVSLQKNGAPYDQLVYEEMMFTPEWQLFTIAGEAPADYGLGGMVLNLQAATGKQVIEMGPIFMTNLGPGAVPGGTAAAQPAESSAPKTEEWYDTGPMNLDLLSRDVRADLDELKARLPAGAVLISDPRIKPDGAYGGTHRVVKDSGVPGGEALEVVTPKPQVESWNVGVNLPIVDNVNQGDTLLLAVWAKAVEANNESQTASLQPIRLQESGGDYVSAAEGVAYLSKDWDLYYLPADASNSFAAGPAGITYHLGLNAQTVRIGPSYVLRFPAGTDPRSLPKNEINYDGRDANAPWRADAMRAIDQHRKADLTITVQDASGQPVPNAQVRVMQTNHAFNLGSFTGHKFVEPQTGDERNWMRVFDEVFNTATLPIYWADWGWSDAGGSHKDDYKRAIQYVARKGIPWRAHTVMWPGERYMPERMKADMSAKKRRKLVEDQVREVVTHIRDAENPPFAVDMTNEPRANRFFQENGDPELVPDMFKLAHKIAPDLKLFVNDYAILNNGASNQTTIDYYHEWIRSMRAKGVPLHGIGFQGHFSSGLTSPVRIQEVLRDFAQYGLPLHITEFDVETLDDDAQADFTRDMLLASLAVPEVEAFIFWQFWEGDHWKPNAAMLRRDWSEKPAYGALKDLMFDTLWTDEMVTADASGQVRMRPMQGTFTVQVDGDVQTVELGPDGASMTLRGGG